MLNPPLLRLMNNNEQAGWRGVTGSFVTFRDVDEAVEGFLLVQ